MVFSGHQPQVPPLFYFSKVLNFGLRSAPALFDRFAEALRAFMIYEGVTVNLDRYVDDFLVIAESEATCKANLSKMLEVCGKSGFAVQPAKVTCPARISEDTVSEIKNILAEWRTKTTGTKRGLLSLVGKLAFAARVVRSGRAF